MEQIAKDRYEGKLKKGELSDDYIRQTFQELHGAAKQGYGDGWMKINKDTGLPSRETIKLQQNLWKFSGAKNYAVLEEINRLMTKNGKPLPFNEFKNEVLKLNPKYNKNYLQAEYQTAKQGAKMAANWERYVENAERYPNLEYRTQNDDRVRDSHASLHGIVAPIDSDFWKSNYPPNGWRCRCYVVQTAADPTKKEKIPVISVKDHPLEFRNNVGISGEIFKETEENKGKPHPYFALAKTADSETQKAFEYSKLAAPYDLIHTGTNKAVVLESFFADQGELDKNRDTAKVIANNGISINIRPLVNVKGHKNPEFEINGILGDGTKRDGNPKNFVGNSFGKLKEGNQLHELKETFIIANFGEIPNLSNNELKSIANDIFYKMGEYKTVINLYIIYNDNLITITREDALKGLTHIKSVIQPMKTQ